MIDITYPPIILSAYGMFKSLGLKFMVEGAEHLPRKGGVVLASNHVSYLDFIFCGYSARTSNRLVRFMAKKSVFDHRISGPLMKSMHHIPVDRAAGAKSLDNAVDWLEQGEVVGVFPEATISQSFELKDFKTGSVRMALQAGVPIVPMITFGGQRLWTKGHKRELERNATVALTLGEPMEVSKNKSAEDSTEVLKSRMQVLYDDTIERYPPPAPGTWWWPARFGGGAPSLAEMAVRDQEDRDRREGHSDSG